MPTRPRLRQPPQRRQPNNDDADDSSNGSTKTRMSRIETIAEGVTLYLGDCREILPTLGKVDAVVTDPPFGISDKPMIDLPGRGGRGNNNYHKATDWDDEIDPAWMELCANVAPVVAWFGQWRKRETIERGMPLPLRSEIIWAKDTHVGPPCPVAMRDERIWLFSEKGIKGKTFETSVWDSPIIPTWAHKNHKNEKPVALMMRLIDFLNPAHVLDPFMGSGTTGVAAVRLGKQFTGVEVDADHFEIACRRVTEATKQTDLFIEKPKPAEQVKFSEIWDDPFKAAAE
jgi:DNA modification methylase